MCVRTRVVPTGLAHLFRFTRHFRAGLSYPAATRLESWWCLLQRSRSMAVLTQCLEARALSRRILHQNRSSIKTDPTKKRDPIKTDPKQKWILNKNRFENKTDSQQNGSTTRIFPQAAIATTPTCVHLPTQIEFSSIVSGNLRVGRRTDV